MSDEIVNRVAQSKLITLDIDDILPVPEIVNLDLLSFSDGGLLREKHFREQVKAHDWSSYANKWVNVYLSDDAIVPLWAYMIIASEISATALGVVQTDPDKAGAAVILKQIERLDLSAVVDKPTVVKGCNRPDVGPDAYMALTERLTPIVKTLMFGEACSTVPVYKPKRKK